MFEVFSEATLGPALGATHGFNVIFISISKGSKFIKSHVNVGANAALDLHGFFGANEIGLAVEWVNEVDAFFGDMGKALIMGSVSDATFFFHGNNFAEARAERHNLEATGVG